MWFMFDIANHGRQQHAILTATVSVYNGIQIVLERQGTTTECRTTDAPLMTFRRELLLRCVVFYSSTWG